MVDDVISAPPSARVKTVLPYQRRRDQATGRARPRLVRPGALGEDLRSKKRAACYTGRANPASIRGDPSPAMMTDRSNKLSAIWLIPP